MPSILTHAIVGAVAVAVAPLRHRPPSLWLLSAGLAMLPDLDVIGYAVGVSRSSLWSHRGISHSLTIAFVVRPALAFVGRRRCSLRWLPLALFFSLVMISHGLLDGLTGSGRGVAYFAPFDARRYSFPAGLIPGAPLGLAYFSARGLRAFRGEVLWVWVPAGLVVAAVTLGRCLATGRNRLSSRSGRGRDRDDPARRPGLG